MLRLSGRQGAVCIAVDVWDTSIALVRRPSIPAPLRSSVSAWPDSPGVSTLIFCFQSREPACGQCRESACRRGLGRRTSRQHNLKPEPPASARPQCRYLLFESPPLPCPVHGPLFTNTYTRRHARRHARAQTRARTHTHGRTHTHARAHAHARARTHTLSHTGTHSCTYARAHTNPRPGECAPGGASRPGPPDPLANLVLGLV